jgi:hypothetical protein
VATYFSISGISGFAGDVTIGVIFAAGVMAFVMRQQDLRIHLDIRLRRVHRDDEGEDHTMRWLLTLELTRVPLILAFMIVLTLSSSAWAQAPTTPGAPVTDGGAKGALTIVGGLVVTLIVIIGSGVRLYAQKRKREAEALHLQARLSDALLREPGLLGLALTATVHAARFKKAPPVVELSGQVPTREARDRALNILRAETARLQTTVQIEDRVRLIPTMAQRAG